MKVLSILTAIAALITATIAPPAENHLNFSAEAPDEISTSVLSYEIDSEMSEDDCEEYVYVSVEAQNISLYNIVEPTAYFFNGENCAEIILSILEDNGYTPVYSGDADESFYLSSIEGIDTSKISITDEALNFLIENGIEYDSLSYEENILGEFDITESSGWIYTVNGEIPAVGMNEYIPKDGDEIKLVFSLYYGKDIELVD